ncbi:MAG: flagellar filament capping protein FliD, partial [Terracidiphilus sp.]
MGTVGLSFGSPTSGQGFNVSSTVASIVSNLQNVEAPWKTQLTTLESQDTAISSLGTLFSSLSNDISSLTDFQGIMSRKTGSSSNTNVLQLTAATSGALAGTHAVTVTNLATTSSGYLAAITNASDTLSGSITLQVGSGKAQTINVPSANGKNTLAGLASAINSSGVGISASVLTDSSGSRLSLVSGTFGAKGNITVSANQIVAASSGLSYSASTGSTASGSLSAITNAGDALSGSMSIQVGSGAAQTVVFGAAPSPPAANTIYTGSGANTLSAVASAITSANIGVTATVVTNKDGSSSLSLNSGTFGVLTVSSSIVDTSDALGYTSTVTGVDAKLNVDGVDLTSASNTVANLIPGLTMQLLAPSATESDNSLQPVQVVIGNDNTDIESTVNQFVSDYNALISAVNTQTGLDTSGNAEPLFGSPTLSLLQQQLLSGLNMQNPNGGLDSISDATDTTLSGSMTIAVGNGAEDTIVVGAGTNTANTFYTGSGVNTLAGLAAAINAANSGTTLSYTGGTGGTTGTLDPVETGTPLSGSLSLTVGSGATENIVIGDAPSTGAAANTIYTGSGSGNNSLAALAGTINGTTSIGVNASVTTDSNGVQTLTLTSGDGSALTAVSGIVAAGPGATATVKTVNGQSTLSLLSQTAGASGALSVTSAIVATSATPLSYGETSPFTSTTPDGGLIGGGLQNDVLAGSMTVQVGNGTATTIQVPSSDATLAGLAGAINDAKLGVTATPVESANGAWSISLVSGVNGSAGVLSITSNLLDATNTTTTNLNYTNSSDVSTLANLGITVSQKDDGSLTFDAASLDSVLNSDYSSVVGFFQNANSWGQTFSNILTNAGTSSSKGVLSLASKSNSSIEST